MMGLFRSVSSALYIYFLHLWHYQLAWLLHKAIV